MPISDTQYQAWLASDGSQRTLLAELDYVVAGQGGLQFRAADQYVSVPNSISLQNLQAPLTLELKVWRWGAGGSAAERIVYRGVHLQLHVLPNGTLEAYYWRSGTLYHFASAYVVPNEWIHVALVIPSDPLGGSLLVNGDAVDVVVTSSPAAGSVNETLYFGGLASGATSRFNGVIDEVRLWSQERPVSEIQRTMWTELSNAEVLLTLSLVGYWKFNEKSGTTAADSSFYGNHGTLHPAGGGAYPTWEAGGPFLATERISNTGFVSSATDRPPHTAYPDALSGVPYFESRCAPDFYGRAQTSFGEASVDNRDGARDGWLTRNWDRRGFWLYLGDPAWNLADFRPVLSATIEQITAEPTRIVFRLGDNAARLDRPVTTRTLGGTTANKDKLVPRTLGEVFNVTPLLVDPATYTYRVNDGPIQALTAVRDSGDRYTVGQHYSVDLASGTFRLLQPPVGEITCDVQGAKFSGAYTSAPRDWMHALVVQAGVPSSITSDASDAASGVYIDSNRTVLEVVNALAITARAFWDLDETGTFRVVRVGNDLPAADAQLTADLMDAGSFQLLRIVPPVEAPKARWRTNYTPQSTVAGSVTAADRDLYAAAYTVAAATDVSIHEDPVSAHLARVRGLEIDTLAANVSGATELANDRARQFARQGAVFSLSVPLAALRLRLGDAVTIVHPRYGFSAGRIAIVTARIPRFDDRRVELEVWVKDYSAPAGETIIGVS